MPSTTRLHAEVANPVLPEAYRVFDNAVSFYPTHRVFDTASDGQERTSGCFFRWCECTAPRFFLGLDARHPIESTPLEPPIVIETTPGGQGIAGQIRQVFIRGFARTGVAPDAHMIGCVAAQPVFDRMALLLITVMVLLCRWIFGAVDWPRRTIMPNRGTWARPSSGRLHARRRNRRLCGREAALGVLRPAATRHGGDEATYGQAMGTSQRADLGLLG
jgi:hypothetical protein